MTSYNMKYSKAVSNDRFPLTTHSISGFNGVFDRARLELEGINWESSGKLIEDIDQFVKDVINGALVDECLIIPVNRHSKAHADKCKSDHLRRFPRYLTIVDCMSERFSFSESLELFREAVRMAKSGDGRTGRAIASDSTEGARPTPLFDDVVRAIDWLYRQGGFQQRLADERSSAMKLYQGGCSYIDRLFAATARMIVVRVDFHYAESIADEVTIDRATADMARMIANVRHNTIFSGLVGYLLKLECGVFRGFHWHALFFFNAQVRHSRSHPYIGKTIGEYWQDAIAKGCGTYWTVNGDTKRYEAAGRCCIGLVTYADIETIGKLKGFVLGYLNKRFQYALPRNGRRYRTFRRGQAPVVVKRRPRSVDMSIAANP